MVAHVLPLHPLELLPQRRVVAKVAIDRHRAVVRARHSVALLVHGFAVRVGAQLDLVSVPELGVVGVRRPVVAGFAEGEEVLDGRELDLVGDVLAARAEVFHVFGMVLRCVLDAMSH